jgi:hypothetical protein
MPMLIEHEHDPSLPGAGVANVFHLRDEHTGSRVTLNGEAGSGNQETVMPAKTSAKNAAGKKSKKRTPATKAAPKKAAPKKATPKKAAPKKAPAKKAAPKKVAAPKRAAAKRATPAKTDERLFTAEEMMEMSSEEPVEHALPLGRAVLERLAPGPALRVLLDGPPDAIVTALRARWARIESDAVAAFAAKVLEASPSGVLEGVPDLRTVTKKGPNGEELFAIVDGSDAKEVWLELRPEPRSGDPEPGDYGDGLSFFLGEPIARDEVVDSLASAAIAPLHAMVEFFTTFGELRDSAPPLAGAFALPSAEDCFDAADHDDEDGSRQAWDGAAVIYSARNGDNVLVNAQSEVAWAVMETGEVRAFGRFEDLLHAYLATRGSPDFRVFDSWSSEEVEAGSNNADGD